MLTKDSCTLPAEPFFNEKACKCECPLTTVNDCAEGAAVNPANCQCECTDKYRKCKPYEATFGGDYCTTAAATATTVATVGT